MHLDKESMRMLRVAIDQALTTVAKKHGLKSLVAGNATFNDASGSFQFKLEGVTSAGIDKAGQLYNLIRSRNMRLPPLGTSFDQGGGSYKIVGANSTGTKVLAQMPDGKKYLFRVAGIEAIFNPANKVAAA